MCIAFLIGCTRPMRPATPAPPEPSAQPEPSAPRSIAVVAGSPPIAPPPDEPRAIEESPTPLPPEAPAGYFVRGTPGVAAIRGVVRDVRSGERLAGVVVIASSDAGTQEVAITDEDGNYLLNRLATARWTLVFYTFGRELEVVDLPAQPGLTRVVDQDIDASVQASHSLVVDVPVIASPRTHLANGP